MNDLLIALLGLVNETLTAAIVVVSASMLLYNLSRNLRNRLVRTSGMLLACITVVYICDVFISLRPGFSTFEATLRVQWIGIALAPAAIFHLSDALLATTGLPSRGRRRRIIRLLYLLSILFLLLAAFTDILIIPVRQKQSVFLSGGTLFPVYTAYFVVASVVSIINVQRARKRCLTRDTRRRMGYLQVAMLTPVFGIFPYSVVFGLSEDASIAMLILVNTANLFVILMLLFLSYPLSFFGTRVPDRVVKTQLLQFVMRGPATGLLALAVIIFLTPATRVLGLPGNSFMPFAVVAVVLLWQWLVALTLPHLEKLLIYSGEDDDQLEKLQTLSQRLLTRSDLLQLLEAILAACCDYLQVNTAFAVSFISKEKAELVAAIGPTRPNANWLEEENEKLQHLLHGSKHETKPVVQRWHSYWIVALHSRRQSEPDEGVALIGCLGIQARAEQLDLTVDEWAMLGTLAKRASSTLDDMTLQTEIYAALEGLLPQIAITRTRAAEVEFRPGYQSLPPSEDMLPEREQFIEQVRAALRHYWGGPGLTHSRLLELEIVSKSLPENGNNPARALRTILQKAIEKQRPPGDRKLLSPEWTLYNILEQRFIEKSKVRDVAIRLALSEPDLYRKQRLAIEAVADTLIEMEQKVGQQ